MSNSKGKFLKLILDRLLMFYNQHESTALVGLVDDIKLSVVKV